MSPVMKVLKGNKFLNLARISFLIDNHFYRMQGPSGKRGPKGDYYNF